MKKRLMLAAVTSLFYANAQAVDLDFAGFLSTVGGVTNASKVRLTDPVTGAASEAVPVYTGKRNTPEFTHDTVTALQFNAAITDRLDLTGQIVGRGKEKFNAKINWGFAKFRVDDHWTVRFGQIRHPYFLMPETLELGYAYPWARPPEEVYSQGSHNNLEGITVSYFERYGKWFYEMMLYHGNTAPPVAVGDTEVRLRIDNSVGGEFKFGHEELYVKLDYIRGKFSWEPRTTLGYIQNVIGDPCGTLKSRGYNFTAQPIGTTCSTTAGTVTSAAADTALATSFNVLDDVGMFYDISFIYDHDNWNFIGEYTGRANENAMVPDTVGWYLTAAYTFGKWTPHLTYAFGETTDNSERVILNDSNTLYSGAGGGNYNPYKGTRTLAADINGALAYILNYKQEAWTVGARWDLWRATALKFDYMYLMPRNNTRGLFSASPARNVSMVRMALDVVF